MTLTKGQRATSSECYLVLDDNTHTCYTYSGELFRFSDRNIVNGRR